MAKPARGFDLGAGPGQPVEREVRGGLVGLILDTRGRPLALPSNRDDCRRVMTDWVEAMSLYPVG